MKTPLRFGAALLAAALVFAACSSDDDSSAPETTAAPETTEATTTTEAAPTANIVETAVAAGTFDTLVAAVEAAGLAETLSGPGPFTVFAPTDDAFAALPEGLVEALLEEPETLAEILTYHVVAGEVFSADVAAGEVPSVQGDTITVGTDGGVTVDGANVTAVDIATSNGVIHVIDAVILPEGIELPSLTNTIADVAAEAGIFNTLLAAAEGAGLIDALSNPDNNFTVFAPSDEAFAGLPDGALDSLLGDQGLLLNVVSSHIIIRENFAADLVEVESVDMLSGANVPVIVGDDGSVMIGNATVIEADIDADNGVIHVIDQVILEGPGNIVDVAQEAGIFTTLLAAAEAADLLGALALPGGEFTVFAPTDEAFAALPEGTVEALLADPETLTGILTSHVVTGLLSAEDVVAAESLTMLSTVELPIVVGEDGSVTIAGSTIIQTDIEASNGIIHVIDTVIIPG